MAYEPCSNATDVRRYMGRVALKQNWMQAT
jgi:hypothetical protein